MKSSSLLPLALLLSVIPHISRSASMRCDRCRSPKFHDREFYLPFCSEDEEGNRETHPNICGAMCAENASFAKGSCDKCETKCSSVFLPVCSKDQSRLFANECHAKCAGLVNEEGHDDDDEQQQLFVDCLGLNIVIPGKTKLPPNRLPQSKLQELEKAEEDQDVDKENES